MKKYCLCLLILTCLFTLIFSINANAATSDYEQQLTELYSVINNGVLNGEQSIDISTFHISVSDADNFINTYIWENPEYAFCITGRNYRHLNGQIVSLNFIYDNPSTIRKRHEEINKDIEHIISFMDPNLNQVEQVAWINDYICDTFQYDISTEYHTIDKFLETETGICEAYTNLFTALCKRLGIKVSYCYSNEIQHIWNMVCLDGAWYHVDSTWNDSYSDRYEFFLLSDQAAGNAIATSQTTNFSINALHKATSTKYDKAFWRDGLYSSMENINGKTYIVKDWTLYTIEWSTLSIKKVANLNDKKWSAPGGNNSYYLSCFTDIEKVGNCIYYTTPNGIRKFDTVTHADVSIVNNASYQQVVSIKAVDGGFEIRYNNDFNKDITQKKTVIERDVLSVKYVIGGETVLVQFYGPNDSIVLPTKLYATNVSVPEWSVTNGSIVTSNMMVTANIAPSSTPVKVQFKVGNTIHKEYTISMGDYIPLPVTPNQTSDNVYDYIFSEWVGYQSGMKAIQTEYVFYASFAAVKRIYTVTFYKEGIMIKQEQLDAGSIIEFPTVDSEYIRSGKKYVFVGWDTQASVILDNMRINAVYAEVGGECTISYVVDDEVVKTETVASGTVLKYPQFIPTKNSDKYSYFVFNNWIGPEEGTYVVEDITLVASFKAEPLPDDMIVQDDRGKITTFFNFEFNTVAVVVVVIALVILAWYILFKRR